MLDLRPSDKAYDRERVEEHADELRLLYVALTRAKSRCVVTWAQEGQAEHAPLAWLLHGGAVAAPEEAARALDDNAARLRKLDPQTWLAEVQAVANRAGGAISLRAMAAEPLSAPSPSDEADVSALKARRLGRELASIRQRTSYTALAAGVADEEAEPDPRTIDLPDHDEATVVEDDDAAEKTPPDEGPSVFTFPGGGRTGRCLHAIFERLLDDPASAQPEETCRDLLPRFGFKVDKWLPVVLDMVENALATPLARPGEADSVFRLSDLKRPVAEMEFHLPLRPLLRSSLGDCLRAHGYDAGVADGEDEINGFLHGYIDLVARHDGRWYVLDYKSNWLGPDRASYSDDAIRQSMRRHGYHLQYLLYLTALHRLLRTRLPDYDYDRHVGGAFYLFLRAMRPSVPGSGVFNDRPTRACIEAIDACFGETR